MTAGSRTVMVFAGLWLALAVAQCTRSAGICDDGTAASRGLWALQFAMLGVPMFVLHRTRPAQQLAGGTSAVGVMLVLLAYVPVTLALRLAELCVAHR